VETTFIHKPQRWQLILLGVLVLLLLALIVVVLVAPRSTTVQAPPKVTLATIAPVPTFPPQVDQTILDSQTVTTCITPTETEQPKAPTAPVQSNYSTAAAYNQAYTSWSQAYNTYVTDVNTFVAKFQAVTKSCYNDALKVKYSDTTSQQYQQAVWK
jgi:hypothetical protein